MAETKRTEYKCDFPDCEKTFKKNWRLVEHQRQHTGERPYVCGFEGCNKTFIRPYHLKRHILTHTEQEKKFKCSSQGCDKAFALKHNLDRHLKRSHGNKFKCDFEGCYMEFKKSNLLKRHVCLVHNKDKKIYKCEVEGCDAGFNYPNLLKKHMRRHNKGYICSHPGCLQAFETHNLLRRHIRSHGYTCSKCGKVFPEVFELKRHVVVHDSSREVIPCPKEGCAKFYSKASNLKKHIQAAHEGVRPFECPVENCGKTFVHKVSLNQHMAFHNSGKPVSKASKKKKQKSKKKRRRTEQSVQQDVPLARVLSGYQSTSASEQHGQEGSNSDACVNSDLDNSVVAAVTLNAASQVDQTRTNDMDKNRTMSDSGTDFEESVTDCRPLSGSVEDHLADKGDCEQATSPPTNTDFPEQSLNGDEVTPSTTSSPLDYIPLSSVNVAIVTQT